MFLPQKRHRTRVSTSSMDTWALLRWELPWACSKLITSVRLDLCCSGMPCIHLADKKLMPNCNMVGIWMLKRLKACRNKFKTCRSKVRHGRVQCSMLFISLPLCHPHRKQGTEFLSCSATTEDILQACSLLHNLGWRKCGLIRRLEQQLAYKTILI